MKINRSFQADWKHLLAIGLLTILLLVLQQSVFSNLLGGHYVPQFMAIIIMFLAFYWGKIGGLIFCWLLGILLDFQIAILLGPSMISCLLIYMLFSAIANNLYINSQFVLILSGAVGAFLLIVFQQIAQGIFLETGVGNFSALFKDAIATAIFTPILFPILSKWFLTSSKL